MKNSNLPFSEDICVTRSVDLSTKYHQNIFIGGLNQVLCHWWRTVRAACLKIFPGTANTKINVSLGNTRKMRENILNLLSWAIPMIKFWKFSFSVVVRLRFQADRVLFSVWNVWNSCHFLFFLSRSSRDRSVFALSWAIVKILVHFQMKSRAKNFVKLA